MKTHIKVCDCMKRKPISIDKSCKIKDAAKIIREKDIESLIILGENDLEGFITHEQFVKAISKDIDVNTGTVEEVMIKRGKIITISPSADISDAIELLNEHDLRQLPVVDSEDSKLVGLLTTKDIMKVEPQIMDIISEKLEILGESGEEDHIFSKHYSSGYCAICGTYSENLSEKSDSLVCPNCK